ncbi:hypothetical protein [Yinghuangia sp. YIM S09857]|uniref:hypothetical protein n=1 Tax=Yinghuangia sp. YIM S09857 TaxID=3436929 RepID=UPI003F52F28B
MNPNPHLARPPRPHASHVARPPETTPGADDFDDVLRRLEDLARRTDAAFAALAERAAALTKHFDARLAGILADVRTTADHIRTPPASPGRHAGRRASAPPPVPGLRASARFSVREPS